MKWTVLPFLLLLASGCATQAVRVTTTASGSQSSGATGLDVCTVWGTRGINTDQWLADQFKGTQDPFFRSVNAATALDDVSSCDLAVVVRMEKKVSTAEAFSAYTKESLFRLETQNSAGAAFMKAITSQGSKMLDEGAPTRLGAAVFKAVSEDRALFEKLKSQRDAAEAKRREEEAAQALAKGGMSKTDIKALREVLAGSAAAKKEEKPVKSSDIDQPRYRLPERPQDFALVIGIEEYSALPAASYAERDAEVFKNHLIAQGLPVRNVVQLTGSKATKTGLTKYLEEWLPRNVTPESRVYFYFSGHGAPDVATQQSYLVPWDGDANFLDSTAYPIKRLYQKLGDLKAKEVVVAMDACFSGSGGRSVLAKGARPLVTKVDAGMQPPDKLVVFSAADATEITSALDDEGHGIFTYYFLKGIGGAAKDPSGRVTARGLFEYLRPKVADAARRQNREQSSVLKAADPDVELSRF